MSYKIPAAFTLALMLGLAATAQADSKNHDRRDHGSWSARGKHDRDWRDHGRQAPRADWRSHRDNDRRDGRANQRREVREHHYSDYRRYPYYRSQVRYRVSSYYRPQGYRYHAWRSGDRLPVAYYAPRYVIRDYGAYRLHRPPYGYHWVRVDNDVVLAAIATGAVLQVVNHLFY